MVFGPVVFTSTKALEGFMGGFSCKCSLGAIEFLKKDILNIKIRAKNK